MTNFESITAAPGTLAEFLTAFKDCMGCPIGKDRENCYIVCDSLRGLVNWLNSEANEQKKETDGEELAGTD